MGNCKSPSESATCRDLADDAEAEPLEILYEDKNILYVFVRNGRGTRVWPFWWSNGCGNSALKDSTVIPCDMQTADNVKIMSR